MRAFLQKVPVPAAGLALGLSALGNALPSFLAGAAPLTAFFEALAALLLVLVAGKAILCPQALRADFSSSIVASVSATFFMATMQVATYAHAFVPQVAHVVWALAVLGHVALILWFSATFMRRFKLVDVYPTYFICYVGIVVASLTSPTFGCEPVGRVLVVFGAACYAVLLVVVTLRYARHEAPEPARPLFCIYAAPMSLSLAGYLNVFADPSAPLVCAVAVLAQLLLLLVLTRLPQLLRLPFYPSYAAMTFPFVISAVALNLAAPVVAELAPAVSAVAQRLATVEFAFAAAMVCYVAVRYAGFFLSTLATVRAARLGAAEE